MESGSSGGGAGGRDGLTGAQHELKLSLDGVAEVRGHQRLGSHFDPGELVDAAYFEARGAEFTQEDDGRRRSGSNPASEDAPVTAGHVEIRDDQIETAA